MARLGWLSLGGWTWSGQSLLDLASLCWPWLGVAWAGLAWLGQAGLGFLVWLDDVGMFQVSVVRLAWPAGRGLAWLALAWLEAGWARCLADCLDVLGLSRFGLVCFTLPWLGWDWFCSPNMLLMVGS